MASFMDDMMKYALAALLVLIGSHLLLWSWLKRKIAAVQREIEREKAETPTPIHRDDAPEG